MLQLLGASYKVIISDLTQIWISYCSQFDMWLKSPSSPQKNLLISINSDYFKFIGCNPKISLPRHVCNSWLTNMNQRQIETVRASFSSLIHIATADSPLIDLVFETWQRRDICFSSLQRADQLWGPPSLCSAGTGVLFRSFWTATDFICCQG